MHFWKMLFAFSAHEFAAICMDEKVLHLNTVMNEFTGNSLKMINKMVYTESRLFNFGWVWFSTGTFHSQRKWDKMMTKAGVAWIIHQKSDFKSPKALNFLLLLWIQIFSLFSFEKKHRNSLENPKFQTNPAKQLPKFFAQSGN